MSWIKAHRVAAAVARTQIKTVVPGEDIPGNETALVGTEVVPGRTVLRAKSVVDRGNTMTDPAIIKLSASDYEVYTSGCPTFHRIK